MTRINGGPICWGAGILLALTLSVGCGPIERLVDSGVRDGILHINNGSEVPDLDPHVVSGTPEFHIIDALFEGLVDQDPRTREILPALAERWEISEDRQAYTFYLRSEARWSNGSPLTARDFVRSYERALNPNLGSDYAYLFEIIKGGRAYLREGETDFNTVGVHAVSDHVLKIELEHPVPYFLTLMTYPCWRPLPIDVIEEHGGLHRRGSRWTRAGNLVSSGPFVLSRWEPNRVLAVERNPLYWDAETVSLNAIHFYPIESADTEERMFRSGQLHITENVPLTKVQTYREMPDSPLRIDPQLGTYFYRFNTTRPPFDDPRVRRALSLAIDREAIVAKVTGRGESIAGSFTPPGAGGFEPAELIHFSPDEARELLAEAGYPGGEGFPTNELLYNTSDAHRTVAEAIQQMWRTELGIEFQLYNQEWKVYLDSLDSLDFSAARSGWVAVYDDANQFLEIFTSGNPNNRTGFSDPKYDELQAASMFERDPARRLELLRELDALLVRDAVIAPIYHYTKAYLIDPRVQNWFPGPLDKRRYKYVRLGE
ncbi:MAG: peptide ABC transporter substrate-binding protein [Synoicihabitans sp.]